MNVILEHCFIFLSFATSNIEASSIGMSLDDVTFVSEFSFLSSLDFKPTAGVFACICNNIDSVVWSILEDAQSMIVALRNDGEFMVFCVDMEVLVLVVVMLINL